MAAKKKGTKPKSVKSEVKEAVKPKVEKKNVEPKKVAVVFVKDAPKFGKKGEVYKMTLRAMNYINSQVAGAVKKK